MIRKLYNSFFSGRVAMLIVPKSIDVNACAVLRCYKSLSIHRFPQIHRFLLIDRESESLGSASTQVAGFDSCPKLFVLAHGEKDSYKFISEVCDIGSSSWWLAKRRFGIGYFHACFGTNVLSTGGYDNIVDDWVSYNCKLPIIIGLSDTDARWQLLFQSISGELQSTNSGISLRSKLLALYYNELGLLQNETKLSIGKRNMMISLDRAIRGITCKEIKS